jgi:hypothetical protein
MVDLPSTTLGWNQENDRPTSRKNLVGLAGQTFNGTQRKLLNNLLKSLILAQIERWRHG